MKKALSLLVLPLLVIGLSANKSPNGFNKALDGYIFEGKQYSEPSVTISVVLFPSEKELEKWAWEHEYLVPTRTTAFSVLTTDRTKCTIYMVDPDKDYQPESIGHEAAHCFFGNWHPAYDKLHTDWQIKAKKKKLGK